MANTAVVNYQAKTQRENKTDYLISEITAKMMRNTLTDNFLVSVQKEAEKSSLWMVILMLLELDHPHCKSAGVRKSYINFLMSCQEEYILFHMLTVKARAFTDKELIDLALKLVRHSSRDTIRLAGELSKRLPAELLTAMKEFND